MVTPRRPPNLLRVKAGHLGLRLWRPPSPAVLGRVCPPPPEPYSRPYSNGIPTRQLPDDFRDRWPHTGEPPSASRNGPAPIPVRGRACDRSAAAGTARPPPARRQSEERRVGKECRSRWSPY